MPTAITGPEPMIHIFCSEPTVRAEVARAIPHEIETASGSWSDDFQAISGADCSVVVLTEADAHRGVGLIQRILESRRSCVLEPSAVVVVEAAGDEAQRPAAQPIPFGVIPRAAIAAMLMDEVARSCARAALDFATDRLRARPRVSDLLARAIRTACRCDPPVTTVRALAECVGCHYTNLEYHSRKEAIGGLLLRHFLDRTLLLWARARKSSRISWTDVGVEYGIHPERLRRVARRVAGHWPSVQDCAGWMAIARDYREEVRRAFP